MLSPNPQVKHFQSWQTKHRVQDYIKSLSKPFKSSTYSYLLVSGHDHWPTSSFLLSWFILFSNPLEISNFPIQTSSRDWQGVPTMITDRPSQIISIRYFSQRMQTPCQIVDEFMFTMHKTQCPHRLVWQCWPVATLECLELFLEFLTTRLHYTAAIFFVKWVESDQMA